MPLNKIDEAPASVQSATDRVTGTAEASEEAVSSVTNSVGETAASIDDASSSVAQGVDDTKASVASAKEGVTEAASSVKSAFGGLFGRNKDTDDEESPSETRTDDESPSETRPVPSDEPAPSTADPAFAAGDVLTAKIDNVSLYAQPSAASDAAFTVTATDPLVYLGEEADGFLRVQATEGQGWVQAVLVSKQ